jgi:hypothetical protein
VECNYKLKRRKPENYKTLYVKQHTLKQPVSQRRNVRETLTML